MVYLMQSTKVDVRLERNSYQRDRINISEQTWKMSRTWLIKSLSKRTLKTVEPNENESLTKHLLFAKQPGCNGAKCINTIPTFYTRCRVSSNATVYSVLIRIIFLWYIAFTKFAIFIFSIYRWTIYLTSKSTDI